MYSLVTTSIIQGIKSIPVYVEADVSDGMPLFEMVGSLSPEVKESKEHSTEKYRVYSAAKTYHDQFYPCQYQKDRIRLRPSGCCRSALCHWHCAGGSVKEYDGRG